MNSTQGRDTIFTNVNMKTIIPPKHHLKKSQQTIKEQQGFVPRQIKGKEIFEDGGKKKYEYSRSIDYSKSKIDPSMGQKKGQGQYNTEILRRQLENNPASNQQAVRNEDSKKIKTFFHDPSIKLNTINADFTVKPGNSQDADIKHRPNYYLSSKNIQRTMNQENQFSMTSKLNDRKSNLSTTCSNFNAMIDQYKSVNHNQENSSMKTTTTTTTTNSSAQQFGKPTHHRSNTETGAFNQVPRNQYKNIHTHQVGLASNGVGFYMY